MSFVPASLVDVVKKQYKYKLKAFVGIFTTLLVLQLIAILFSFAGVGSMGTSTDGIQFTITYFSSDLIIAFTIMGVFILSIIMTTKAYRYDDFSFVTNRLSSNLSNYLILITTSIVGGLTAMLSGYVLKTIVYFFVDVHYIQDGFLLTDFLIGLVATILYLLLVSSVGYFVGMLIQLHRFFGLLLPVLFFIWLIVGTQLGIGRYVAEVFAFFVGESLLLLFAAKVILTVFVLYSSAALLANRLEVRQ